MTLYGHFVRLTALAIDSTHRRLINLFQSHPKALNSTFCFLIILICEYVSSLLPYILYYGAMELCPLSWPFAVISVILRYGSLVSLIKNKKTSQSIRFYIFLWYCSHMWICLLSSVVFPLWPSHAALALVVTLFYHIIYSTIRAIDCTKIDS